MWALTVCGAPLYEWMNVEKSPYPLIRRATLEDADALAAFAEQTFRDTFGADNDPHDMDAYCASAFSVDAQRSHILDPNIDVLVAPDDSEGLIGYAHLREGAPPGISVPAPIELWRFYLARAHHGRGIARHLMDAVVAAGLARGRRTLWLGVWERNRRARAFYSKSGFTDIGEHVFVLGRDVQTDRLMARPIP